MRVHRIIINGVDTGTREATGSPLELQHNIVTNLPKESTRRFVRVIERVRVVQRPKQREIRP